MQYQCFDFSENIGQARPCTFALRFSEATELREFERAFMVAWEGTVPKVTLKEMIDAGVLGTGRDMLQVADKCVMEEEDGATRGKR